MAAPPVAITTDARRCRISSAVPWIVTWSRHWTRPGGAPACSAARASTAAVAAPHRTPRGWGAQTMALPAFTADRVLKMIVAVGFVTGISAATTPIGSPIAATFAASSRHSTPRARTFRSHSATDSALNRFLIRLSGTFPCPVSSTARRASRSASGSMARAMLSTIASMASGGVSRNASQASHARSAARRAAAIERRSASISAPRARSRPSRGGRRRGPPPRCRRCRAAARRRRGRPRGRSGQAPSSRG